MLRNYLSLGFAIVYLLMFSCTDPEQKPLRYLDDIAFDKNLDKEDFLICHGENNVFQYFNLGDNIAFKGGKRTLINVFKENYDPDRVKQESGLIRIRFIVNCQRETDRFRLLTSGLDYQEKAIDKSITDQLLAITKSLNGWGPKYNEEQQPIDYYQYLIFKIVDGQIIKILP